MTQTAIRRALAATVMALAVLATAAPLSAIVIIGGKTGLFGVTTDQTIRVSILNAAAKGGVQPCVGLFDITGTLLAEVDGRTLRQGEGTFIDFDAAMLGLPRTARMPLRVEVTFEIPPDPNGLPDAKSRVREGQVALTVEVFDNDTGKTSFLVPVTP
jgi:hypothetical protein